MKNKNNLIYEDKMYHHKINKKKLSFNGILIIQMKVNYFKILIKLKQMKHNSKRIRNSE